MQPPRFAGMKRELQMIESRASRAAELMAAFAGRTGLVPGRAARRYLWTDAFAVLNYLALRRATGDERHLELALALVEQVHHVLGRHRSDDLRRGWISGLSEVDGEKHPTRGGLRIGKRLPERDPAEPYDPQLEWERDGQYFHYLTKWMSALDAVARETGRATYHVWARELAVAAHDAFVHGPPGRRRMAWKLSIDLSRPLVPSMGQHDPLDGFVTCLALDATAPERGFAPAPSLAAARAAFAEMLDPRTLATTDPLGLGGLLLDAWRLVKIDAEPELAAALLVAAVEGVTRVTVGRELRMPAASRLAFRELGLAIGLGAVSTLGGVGYAHRLAPSGKRAMAELIEMASLREEIEAFWLVPDHRRNRAWHEHEDINDVMLATMLVPEGMLA